MFDYIVSKEPKIQETMYTCIGNGIDGYFHQVSEMQNVDVNALPHAWRTVLDKLCMNAVEFIHDCAAEIGVMLEAEMKVTDKKCVSYIFTRVIQEIPVAFRIDIDDYNRVVEKWQIYLSVSLNGRFYNKILSPKNPDLAAFLHFLFYLIHDYADCAMPAIMQEARSYPNFDTAKTSDVLTELKLIDEQIKHGTYPFPLVDKVSLLQLDSVEDYIKALSETYFPKKYFRKKKYSTTKETGYRMVGYLDSRFRLEVQITYLPRYGIVEIEYDLIGDGTRRSWFYRGCQNVDKIEAVMPVFLYNATHLTKRLDTLLAQLVNSQ
ncbi:MAG: hypothetical protein IJX53_07775 [Clostridia bacterium]|nr:hypothetical protein [Clostridia bacterium]